jgi:hypothetical protein
MLTRKKHIFGHSKQIKSAPRSELFNTFMKPKFWETTTSNPGHLNYPGFVRCQQ